LPLASLVEREERPRAHLAGEVSHLSDEPGSPGRRRSLVDAGVPGRSLALSVHLSMVTRSRQHKATLERHPVSLYGGGCPSMTG